MSDPLSRITALPAEKRALLLRQLQEQRAKADIASDMYDVVILGGGLSGLTLALQIKQTRPKTRIVVIEKKPHPVPEAAHKVGESTVEIAARYFRDVLGLEEHLNTQQLRKFGLRMFFSTEDNQDIARRVELGSTIFPPLCTYQLDRGRLENMLGQKLPEQDIMLINGKVQQFTLQPQSSHHRLQILENGNEREIKARWIIDASGRNTLLQRQLGLTKKVEHNANAVWFRVNHPIDIKEWTTDLPWQARVNKGDRALSTNHLMGSGYWVWLIRLASGSTSVGIVTDARMHNFDEMNLFERALTWLHQHEPQCAHEIEQHRDQIQDFRVMKNYSYSSQRMFSSDRWCLTGEAAVSLDPLYSPGSDLIAIANGLICDLVIRSLGGEDVRGRTVINDRLFLSLTNIWLSIYEQQYSLMDNAQIMVTKIIWDTAFYWGVFGLLYFHDTFRNIADYPGVASNLSRIAVLSNRIQAFYREWHGLGQIIAADAFVDLYSPLNFMVQLHTGMAAELPPTELENQFAANIRLFERLAGQIISTVIETHADSKDQAVQRQLQQWQAEPYIVELLALYQRESIIHPIDSSWIMLGKQKRERLEAAS